MTPRLRGLYAITDHASGCAHADAPAVADTPRWLKSIVAAIAGGAALIQYRDKSTDNARREHDARNILAVCRAYGVPLIINDDVALAATVNADGVHLGRDDMALYEARRILGSAAIIGVSCYNDLDLAVAAQQAGASYVAFGRFFASHTKPDAAPITMCAESGHDGLDLIRQAKAQLSIPVVAIGGITPRNATPLIDAGVDMLAVVHGVFGQTDPEQAARRYTQLFEH